MKRFLCLSMVAVSSAVLAAEAPVKESFDEPLGAKWNANTGEWKVVEGVLRGKELESDQHVAAARRAIVTTDATYELKFRFVGSGKAFNFGFDPAAGQLDKKGHLFSVVVRPNGWEILKHVNKAKPQEDPNESLASQSTPFEKDTWYHLTVTTKGTEVEAVIEGKEPLKATHPTFSVKKPALVFRCAGDGVEVDDVKVTPAE